MKKTIYRTILLGLMGAGISACTVDFSPTGGGGETFSCATDDDCLGGYACQGNVCVRQSGPDVPTCSDADDDGYGVGTLEQRQTCRLCETEGKCGEDCDDTNPAIHPNAPEQCNNADENCNAEIDEPTDCTDDPSICNSLAGAAPQGASYSCIAGRCELTMMTQICTNGAMPCPCNANPLACTAGMYPEIPGPADCLQ